MLERFERLSRFAWLYRSSPGGKAILRQYLGLEADSVVPLSLSHGVDYNYEESPQDYLATEPLHWCYNQEILARTGGSKPGVLLPHPWLLVRESLALEQPPDVAGRVLVIGPPPSPMNDESLYEKLVSAGFAPDAILVKKRGTSMFEESLEFWRAKGVEAVSAGVNDAGHYFRLAKILMGFDRVVLPVFSSVGVFAAALGCEVVAMTNYWHCSYSPRTLNFHLLAKSPSARRFAQLFVEGDRRAQSHAASEYLGQAALATPSELFDRLHAASDAIVRPVHVPAAFDNRLVYELMLMLSNATGRTDFLRYGFVSALRYKLFGLQDALICKRVNMIDALLKGEVDEVNFESRPLRANEFGVRSGEGAVF